MASCLTGLILLSAILVAASPAAANRILSQATGFPYFVSLRNPSDPDAGSFCGGSLVAPNVVLTAAHCVVNDQTDPPSINSPDVYVNSYLLDGTRDTYAEKLSTRRTVVVPAYNSSSLDSDLALLVLSQPSDFAPVKLPAADERKKVGAQMVIIGMGSTIEGGPQPETLQEIILPLVENSVCDAAYSKMPGPLYGRGSISGDKFCTGNPQQLKAACRGDAGGPVIATTNSIAAGDTVVGVVSYGKGCSDPRFYNVHTDVASHLDFINATIKSFSPSLSVASSTGGTNSGGTSAAGGSSTGSGGSSISSGTSESNGSSSETSTEARGSKTGSSRSGANKVF